MDIQEIIRVVSAVGSTADAKDWKGCRALFADEVFVDYSGLTGQAGSKVKADQLIDGWSKVLGPVQATQHMITNFDVRVDAGTAIVRSYVQALHHHPVGQGQDFWTLYGRYEHELVKAGGTWKVTRMKLTPVYQQGNKELLMRVEGERKK